MKPHEDEHAYRRALLVLRAGDAALARKAWDRLERDFGWFTAAQAWRKATATVKADADALRDEP